MEVLPSLPATDEIPGLHALKHPSDLGGTSMSEADGSGSVETTKWTFLRSEMILKEEKVS